MRGDSNAALNFDHHDEHLAEKGYSLTLAEGDKYEVKLRTAHASNEVLGISIRVFKKDRTTIEQYDINPDLPNNDRIQVKMKLLDVFKILASSKTFSEGISNLRSLERSGSCSRWERE